MTLMFILPCAHPVSLLPPNARSSPKWRCQVDTPRSVEDCARDFVTQRAVQQTIFCSFMLRDETNARWLESFLNPTMSGSGLYDVHACNLLGYPSNEYLKRLYQAPIEKLVIKKPIQGRTNNKNPYITRRYFTYEVDIEPSKVAHQVMQVREQIAEELIDDLKCIQADNERISEQHRRMTLTKSPGKEYDLPVASERGGSPYRVATFDLARNYTLYLALDAVTKRANKVADIRWLSEVKQDYDNELLTPDKGHQGASDAVMQHMFERVPAVNVYGTIFDPVSLARRVLDERVHVANVWVGYMQQVNEEHVRLLNEM